MSFKRLLRSASVLCLMGGLAALLSGCEGTGSDSAYKAYAPIPKETLALMADKGTVKDAPMLIRAYKKEAELEVWKKKADGQYVYVKSFPMCRWSGQLGPKRTEGDRQVPEGFYTITPGSMNPNSHYYLSFNVGYPNAYDRANGASGGSIMVHGICSSAGCFSMTDKQIEEIYAIARESFAGGQRAIQMQSFPFHMTAENLAKLRLDPNMPFWRELKKGSDYFEVTKSEPPIGVCNKHYVFGGTPKAGARFDAYEACPPVDEDAAVKAQVAAKAQHDDAEVAELVNKGTKPVRLVYADGGQNPEFAHQFAEVSRPDALAAGATEIALDDGAKSKTVAVQVAAAKARSKLLLAKGNVISPVGPAAVAAPVVVAGPVETTPAPGVTKAVAPVKAASTDVPATFEAAPSAYAKTETKDASTGFFNKWLKIGGATPEAAPAIAVAEPVTATMPSHDVSPGPAKPSTHRPLAAGASTTKAAPSATATPVRASVPAAAKPAQPQMSTTALPKQVTGSAEPAAVPKGLLAWVPGFN